jgi:predicted membrane channel-forming protein YqfA (hemolysin III family)
MDLISELVRRNVLRVAMAYVVAAWLIIQVVETLFPVFGFSDTAIRTAVIVLGIGFVPAVVGAWVFEFTPEQQSDFTIRKQIIWQSQTADDAEVYRREMELIRELESNNPRIGYNRLPKYVED